MKLLAVPLILCSATALAGEVDTSAAVDFFRGESKSDDPLAGEPSVLAAQELGLTLRLDLTELDDRLHAGVDYRGREPLGGLPKSSALRLLYRAEVGYEILRDTLTLSLGRFVADAPLFLVVDGLRGDATLGPVFLSLYGGRRAITTSRRNVAIGDFLPAVGAGARWTERSLQLSLDAAFARDQLPLIHQSDEEVLEDFDAFSVVARGAGRPIDELIVGGSFAFVQRAAYVLGPEWSDVSIDARAFNFVSGVLFADYRPLDFLQLAYQGQFQRAAVFSSAEFQDPNFFDNGLQIGVRPFDLGWARASGRIRIRNDRRELRYGLAIEVNNLGIKGPYLQGSIFYEDITFEAGAPNLDRLLWRAAAGYADFGLDVNLGVSFLERKAAPVSGRAFDPRQREVPGSPEDLSIFVLEAQRIFFARAFYGWEWLFAGVDFERSLTDSETRFFLQAGAYWGTSW